MTRARELAMRIWNSGVDRVRAERLIAEQVHCDSQQLSVCDTEIDLRQVGKICVVGAGKAAGYLAAELVKELAPIAAEKSLHGWVNVPANCTQPLDHVTLHPARPAGVNEPRPEGVRGTNRILDLVASLAPDDLCLCLITGGGSALLPAPKSPVTLEDKLAVIRLLGARGASIQQMNQVRIALSDVKGGRLARRCGAGRLVTLVVSDIIGDPLELIASGPTIAPAVHDVAPSNILSQFAKPTELSATVWNAVAEWKQDLVLPQNQVRACHLLASNHTAVMAARAQAESLGLKVRTVAPESAQSTAEEVARTLVEMCGKEAFSEPCCILWGGEPVVHLSENAGRGGRNQQLALAALTQWSLVHPENRKRMCILSGGTDGEDGPTDAAGAFVDAEIVQNAYNLGLDAAATLQRNDAYSFFDSVAGLIKTGPTHTNVCDLRVAVIA